MSKQFWKAAGIRAIRTFFQSFVSVVGTTALISDVNWCVVLSSSTLAAILSIATSLAGLPEVDEEVVDNTDDE